MSTLSPSSAARHPPPSLFLGPPSRNSSQISLPQLPAPGTSSLSHPQRPALLRPRSSLAPIGRTVDGAADGPSPLSRVRSSHSQNDVQKQRERTDMLWADMQTTLEEVELSASGGTHVFGAEHAAALENLRTSQIALAHAWARSEADEVVLPDQADGGAVKGAGLLGDDEGPAIKPVGEEKSQSRRGSQLEDETESDILLARKRREANDRYFQRVNAGVLDVVAKLEDVAVAVRAVEQESRDIWGETGESSSA